MTRRYASLLALLATIWLSACGGDGEGETAAGAADATTPSPSSGATPASGDRNGTPIRIAFGDTQLTGTLSDNATARDLTVQLPLTLTFRDHRAPGSDLVLYHDDRAPYFDGIVPIGEFDGDLEALRRQSDGFDVSIERAG